MTTKDKNFLRHRQLVFSEPAGKLVIILFIVTLEASREPSLFSDSEFPVDFVLFSLQFDELRPIVILTLVVMFGILELSNSLHFPPAHSYSVSVTLE